MKKLYNYSAEVIRVIDGDTFKALVDLGMGSFTMPTIRLMDVQCPERGKPGFDEATNFAVSKLMGVDRIFLSSIKKDSWKRWLAYVWIPTPEHPLTVSWSLMETFNVELIREGYATHYQK